MTTPAFPPQPPAEPPKTDNDKASFVVGIIGLCFGALSAVWSFIGGACCGSFGWGWAFLGFVLSIVSLCLRRSGVGWTGLVLSIFAFAWVFIQPMLALGVIGTGVAGMAQGTGQSYPRPAISARPSGTPKAAGTEHKKAK